MPLTMAKSGETTTIRRVTGKDEIRRHLANLGFIEGEMVTIVSEIAGSLIINVKGVRVALDKMMASRIMI